MKTLLLSHLLIGMILFSCKSRPVDPETYSEAKIKFGSGGGFTGYYTHYQLLDNGDLFMQKEPDSTMQHLVHLKKRIYKPLFERVTEMDSTALSYNNPGNMTQYIEIQQGDSLYHAAFAMQDTIAPESLRDMYRQLMNLVPKE